MFCNPSNSVDFNFRTRNLLYRSQPALCLSFLAERMETFRSKHFCMRVRIFGNDRRNDYAFAFCDETIYRKKAQVIFFSGAFLPCGRPGYPHFAVFAAHSFTSFRNCSAGATIPNALALRRTPKRTRQINEFCASKISQQTVGLQIPNEKCYITANNC